MFCFTDLICFTHFIFFESLFKTDIHLEREQEMEELFEQEKKLLEKQEK